MQIGLELELLAPRAGEHRRIQRGAVAAAGLHRVHRHVGVAQQSTMVAPSRGYSAMPTLAVTKHSWPPTKIGSRIRSRMRLATRSASRSSPPRAAARRTRRRPGGPPPRACGASAAHRLQRALHHLVGWRTHGAQPARHLHQQFVAGAVAQRVVDDLEAVQVDQQQRHLVAEAARVLERARCARSAGGGSAGRSARRSSPGA